MLPRPKHLIPLMLLFAGISTLYTPNVSAQTSGENKALHQLFNNYSEENLKLFPLNATGQGDNRYNDLLQNKGSQAFKKSLHNFYTINMKNS